MAADTGQIPQFLRTADPDRYLSTLYAPAEKRAALTALYAFDAEIGSNTIEVHVSRLRKKLGADLIRTERGLGYRLGTP